MALSTWRARFEAGNLARGAVALAVGVMLAVSVAGCGSAPSGSDPVAPVRSTAPSVSVAPANSMIASASADSSAQVCLECSQDVKPPVTAGLSEVADGRQTIRIAVVGGVYSPNAIDAKAGVSTQVVFTGNVKGCVSKPQFVSLGKKADMASGQATMDLGKLQPGTYEFTCGMGANSGTVVVK